MIAAAIALLFLVVPIGIALGVGRAVRLRDRREW